MPIQELKDGLVAFDAGINHGVAPELVPRNQLFDADNTSLRGDFAHPRAYYQKRALNYKNPAVKAVVDAAWIQGVCFYKPDTGRESLMLSASGRLYQFQLFPDHADVIDVTGANAQSATATQAWLWQAEKWVIWNDSVSLPVFFDNTATARSRGKVAPPPAYLPMPVVSPQTFVVPYADGTSTVTWALSGNYLGANGDVISIGNGFSGQFMITAGAGTASITVRTIISAVQGTLIGVLAPGSPITVVTAAAVVPSQLPAGRMGTYGMGRVWMCLPDGKQFVASDCVGGSSGTIGENYRDAVLMVSENAYLAGGGNFTVPGSYGEINAMRFAATLDAALGQGPLQVFTANNAFSCQAPVDRLTWQDVTNPILTESLISGGALGQDSTVLANGDIMMRSMEGIRSLILARREFTTWGNTPISNEVDPTFALDSQDLLPWGSAIVFDNRFLMTTGTVLGPHGPYFKGLVPINFDPISTLRGKQPAIYDAKIWEGINVYKLVTGRVAKVDRAFAFCFNEANDELELYEILPEENQNVIADNGVKRVVWEIHSGALFYDEDPRQRVFKRLTNGELWIDDLKGTVDFRVWWKPDQWPCWAPWAEFSECADVNVPTGLPQFRPRLGLGEPPATECDTITNRPLCLGYFFRVRIQITGHCTFKGAKFQAFTEPEPPFAPKECTPICQP